MCRVGIGWFDSAGQVLIVLKSYAFLFDGSYEQHASIVARVQYRTITVWLYYTEIATHIAT